jgi:hypothetical protein
MQRDRHYARIKYPIPSAAPWMGSKRAASAAGLPPRQPIRIGKLEIQISNNWPRTSAADQSPK